MSSFQETALGVTTSKTENYGTTANVRVDLCTGSDTSLTSVHAVMSEYVVLGAGQSNQAMIRPASGAATFYSTVAAAVNAVADGGTVYLCNDISSTDAITVSKACTIETNGMDFKGMIVAGTGYEVTETATTPNVEKMLGKVHRTYVVTMKAGPVYIGGATASASEIVLTSSKGTTASVKESSYAVWTLAGGAWQPVQNYVTDASGKQVAVVTPDADNTNLPRGGAFWLVRQDATKPFYLYGQYTAAAVTATKVTAGTTAAPVLQLLASPKTALNLMTYDNSTESWQTMSGVSVIDVNAGSSGNLWSDLGSASGNSQTSFFIELLNNASGSSDPQVVGMSQVVSYTDLVSNGYISTGGLSPTGTVGSATPWTGTPYTVPEPSSGLLQLLGIGGLLLRRKEGGVA